MTVTGNPPIVTGVDGSTFSLQAVSWAAREAALRNAPLHLVAAMSPPPYGGGLALPPSFFTDMTEEGQRRVDEAAKVAREAVGDRRLVIETDVCTGSPVPALLDRAHHARMLVLGTRGLGELTGIFVGSVALAVAPHSSCPVAVIRGDAAGKEPAGVATGPIVVGVDGTARSDTAVELAFEEASLRNAPLIAVHAWSDPDLDRLFYTSPNYLPWDSIQESEKALLAERLAGWQERYPDVAVERVVTRDRPARSLAELSETAQLVVVGNRGRGGFTGMLLGSTSNTLLHTAKCPLLVTRSPHEAHTEERKDRAHP